jgi:hypothetical protein
VVFGLSPFPIYFNLNRPTNKEELFNLCHSSAHNVIERTFGVLKKCFKILLLPPAYGMDIQAQILATLCALHNFIREHESDDNDQTLNQDGMARIKSDNDTTPRQEAGPDTTNKDDILAVRRDTIAQSMWDDYQQRVLGRHLDADDVGTDNDSDDNDIPVRGHLSVSLLPISSPTLHLFICIHPPHLCTILKDHIHSRRLLGPTVRQLPRSRLINSR